MVKRHIIVCLASYLCFEIDGQIAVFQGWMTRDIFNIVAGHRINGINEMCRFMQPIALALIAL